MSQHNRAPIQPQSYRGEVLQHDMNRHWARRHHEAALMERFSGELTEHSIFMAEHGVSHRKRHPLQVGAVIVGLLATPRYNPNRPNRRTGTQIILLEGHNMSPYKGSPKDCAEQRALRMGDEVIVGPGIEQGRYRLLHEPLRPWEALQLFLASNGQEGINKEINNIDAPTLHCCMTPCQHVLEDHSAVSRGLVISSVRFDRITRNVVAEESFTLGALRSQYADIEAPIISCEQMQQSS